MVNVIILYVVGRSTTDPILLVTRRSDTAN